MEFLRSRRNSKNYIILLNSLLLCLLFLSNILGSIIAISLNIDNVYVILIFMLMILTVVINGISFNRYYILITLYTIVIFSLNYFIFGANEYYINSLLGFIINGICAGYLATKNFNFNLASKFSVPILLIVELWMIFNKPMINGLSLGEKMGFGYSLLPALFLSVNSIQNRKFSLKFVAAINIVCTSYFIISYASRGALLCIIIFIILHLLHFLKNVKVEIKSIILIIVAFLSVLVFFYWNFFLLGIINLLSSLNTLNSSSIIRLLTYYQNNFENFDSGRSYILDLFKKDMNVYSYLIGNGIGEFGVRYSSYTHNLITHLLYEIGFMGSLFYIVILIKCFLGIITNKKNEFLIFLFCLSIPRLMVSSYLWQDLFFWLFILYGINFYHKSKKDIIDKKII
jgi:hypothetical protein